MNDFAAISSNALQKMNFKSIFRRSAEENCVKDNLPS